MQSLNRPVALAVAQDRRRQAAGRRALSPPGRGGSPPGLRRPVAVLAVRVARRLDAEATSEELTRLA